MSNFLVGLDINDVQVSTFSGNASTTAFTLSVAATTNGAAVHISGVRQVPTTDYSIAATTLTFTTAPPTGTNNIAVMYTKTAILNTPADASVTSAKIGNDQVDSQHYAAGSVDLEHMSSQSVDEDNLHISNAGSNGNFLSKQSGDAGGLTWAAVSSDNTIFQVISSTPTTLAVTGLTAGALYEIWGQLGISANASITALFGYGATPTYTTSSYQFAALGYNDANTDKKHCSANDSNIDMHTDTLLGARYAMKFHGHLYASDTSDSAENPTLGLVIDCRTTTANSQNTFVLTARNGGSDYNGSNALTALQFTVSTGNFNHGFLKLREVTQA